MTETIFLVKALKDVSWDEKYRWNVKAFRERADAVALIERLRVSTRAAMQVALGIRQATKKMPEYKGFIHPDFAAAIEKIEDERSRHHVDVFQDIFLPSYSIEEIVLQ